MFQDFRRATLVLVLARSSNRERERGTRRFEKRTIAWTAPRFVTALSRCRHMGVTFMSHGWSTFKKTMASINLPGLAGLAFLVLGLSSSLPAQESAALVDALIRKGILTQQEAEDIRADLVRES